MKIFVVTQGAYSDYRIITATLDEDLANAIAKKFDSQYSRTAVKVCEDAEILLKPCWSFVFNEDGGVTSCTNVSTSSYHYENAVYDAVMCGLSTIVVTVIADNYDAAVKIASEKRAQYLAEKAGIA